MDKAAVGRWAQRQRACGTHVSTDQRSAAPDSPCSAGVPTALPVWCGTGRYQAVHGAHLTAPPGAGARAPSPARAPRPREPRRSPPAPPPARRPGPTPRPGCGPTARPPARPCRRPCRACPPGGPAGTPAAWQHRRHQKSFFLPFLYVAWLVAAAAALAERLYPSDLCADRRDECVRHRQRAALAGHQPLELAQRPAGVVHQHAAPQRRISLPVGAELCGHRVGLRALAHLAGVHEKRKGRRGAK